METLAKNQPIEGRVTVERPFGPRRRSLVAIFFALAAATSSLVTVRLAPTVTLTDGLLAVCLFLAVGGILMESGTGFRRPRLPRAWAIGAWLVLLGGVTSSLFAVNPSESLAVVMRLGIVVGLLPILAWLTIKTTSDLSIVAGMVSLAGGLQGVAAILQLLGVRFAYLGDPQFGRYTGFADHPNVLGAATAVALPIGIAAILGFGRFRARTAWFHALACTLAVAGLILSGSLSAMPAAMLGCLTVLIAARRNRGISRLAFGGAVLSAIIVMVLAVVIIRVVVEAPAARSSTVKDASKRVDEVIGQDGTIAQRLLTLEIAVERIGSNPLLGEGFDREGREVVPGRTAQQIGLAPHNMLVFAWFSGGLFTFAGVLLVIAAAIRVLLARRRRAFSDKSGLLLAGVLGSLVAVLVNGVAQPFLWDRFYWIPIALAFSPALLYRAAVLRGRHG